MNPLPLNLATADTAADARACVISVLDFLAYHAEAMLDAPDTLPRMDKSAAEGLGIILLACKETLRRAEAE